MSNQLKKYFPGYENWTEEQWALHRKTTQEHYKGKTFPGFRLNDLPTKLEVEWKG